MRDDKEELLAEALEVITSTTNFLRGLCLAPSMSKSSIEAIRYRITIMDQFLDSAFDEEE